MLTGEWEGAAASLPLPQGESAEAPRPWRVPLSLPVRLIAWPMLFRFRTYLPRARARVCVCVCVCARARV